jgi:hypothetical protein
VQCKSAVPLTLHQQTVAPWQLWPCCNTTAEFTCTMTKPFTHLGFAHNSSRPQPSTALRVPSASLWWRATTLSMPSSFSMLQAQIDQGSSSSSSHADTLSQHDGRTLPKQPHRPSPPLTASCKHTGRGSSSTCRHTLSAQCVRHPTC